MNHTNIEWIVNPDGSRPGWSWNPITGCLNGCEYCYARKLANGRLKPLYLANSNWCHWNPPENGYYDPFYPRFWEDRLIKADKILKASKKALGIFPCDMSDWCGIGIPESWSDWVLELARRYPQHRLYLLTKQPQNLIKFSPFPDNCWVGVTVTNRKALMDLRQVFGNPINTTGAIRAKVKYISFEPLLEPVICKHEWIDKAQRHSSRDRIKPHIVCVKCGRGQEWGDHNNEFIGSNGKPIINWLIIGACTGTKVEMSELAKLRKLEIMPYGNKWTAQPKIEWVREIVEAADKAGIKVFLKDNLKPLLEHDFKGIKGVDGRYAQLVDGIWQLRQEMPI